jgi:hypothetical protein
MDAVLPSGIGAGGYDASYFRASPDGEGLADKGRIALLFDCTKEGIHIQMNDHPRHPQGIISKKKPCSALSNEKNLCSTIRG